MSDVFISYAREDKALVRRLHAALEKSERQAWVDWEGIPPTAEWMEEIYGAIDGADTFVFVLSPDSLASATCAKELEHASQHNKRLVPIVGRDPGERRVPEALARLNWIFLRDEDDFDAGFALLVAALDSDLEHVKLHTRYLKRAVDWERKDRDTSLTLRGSELRAAEEWLAASGDKEPRPTSLQNRYILDSRRAATRRQRIVGGSVAAGLLVALGLGLVGLQQRNEKRRQRQLNVARQLVGQSNLALDEREELLETSVQLAAEAMRRLDALGVRSLDADQALRQGLALLPEPPDSDSLKEPLGSIRAVAISPGGRYLAIAKELGDVLVWDQVERRRIGEWRVEVATPGSFRALAINPRGDRVLTGVTGGDGEPRSRLSLWAVANAEEVAGCELDADLGIASRYEISADGRYWLRSGRIYRLADCGEVELWGDDLVVSDLTLSADGRRLAASLRRRGEREYRIEIRDLAAGVVAARWPHEGRLRLEFLDRDRKLAGFGRGGLTVWDLEDPARPTRREIADPIEALSADGRFLVTRDKDRLVAKLRSTESGEELERLVHPHQIEAAAFGPEGSYLTTFTLVDQRVRRWRLRDGERWISREPGRRVVFDPDGRFLAAAGEDALLVWDLAERREASRLTPTDPAAGLAFAGQPPSFTGETTVLRAVADGWEIASPPQPGRGPLPGAAFADLAEREKIHASAACPDESRVAVTSGGITRAGWEASTWLWDVDRGARLATFDLVETAGGMRGLNDASVGLLACSGDGRYLATPANDAVVVWEIDRGSLLTRLPHPGLSAFTFDPTGEYLATAGRGPVRIWEVATSLEVARLLDGAPVAALAFGPDGRWLATAGAHGVGLWPWRPADLVAEACARLAAGLPASEWERLFADEPYQLTCPPRT